MWQQAQGWDLARADHMWRVHWMNLLEELKLLTIMRAMLQTGELFNEQLVLGGKAGSNDTVSPVNR